MQTILTFIPWVMMAMLISIPFLCIFLYTRKRICTCLLFSHLWCMITFFLLGVTVLHGTRRGNELREYTDKARQLLDTCKTLRSGDTQKTMMRLDDHLSETLYRTAYDIADDEMDKLDPNILWIWQEVKEYFDTYPVKEPYVGSMIPHVRGKLVHVPWSDMQLAIKKFEQTYKSGKRALAPAIQAQSWVSRPLAAEELRGRVILLDFWNTGCGPCVKSLPTLQKIHDTYKTKGLVVIACAAGDETKTKQFLDKHGYTFPACMISNQMLLDYAIRGNPSYFMIDRDGYLMWGPKSDLPSEKQILAILDKQNKD